MTFINLLRTDLIIFFQTIRARMISLGVWATVMTIIGGYVLQISGIAKDFGKIQVTGVVVAIVAIEVHGNANSFMTDVFNGKNIYYRFSLPMPNYLILLEQAIVYAISNFVLSLSVIPLAKIILLDKFDLSGIDYIRLFIIIFTSSIFFGIFTLFIVSFVKNMEQIRDVFTRLLFPLWFLGGFQFSFKSLNEVYPALSYICLISPYTYTVESVRSAILKNYNSYIPFYSNISILILGMIFISFVGYIRLKKKLDIV